MTSVSVFHNSADIKPTDRPETGSNAKDMRADKRNTATDHFLSRPSFHWPNAIM